MSNQDDANSNEVINLKDYILQKKIGSGSFGKVYLVKDKEGQIYASKISIENIESSTNAKFIDFSREINIISKLNHPSVLKFIGCSPTDFKKRPRPVIITEYVSNGSLSDLISNDICNETMKLIIIYGIASGMSYLHAHDIIHRDLKPDNILIDDNLFPKIADFGLSKMKSEKNTNSISTIGIKGTPIYIAPEIWKDYEYGKASDVYAFAFIVYELLTSEKPFDNCNILQIQCKILQGYRPEFNKPIQESYKNLIKSCWSEDPTKRPSFDQIVDQLKNDRGFITENIDEEKFRNYINFISESRISFDPTEFEIFKIFKDKKPLDLSAFENIVSEIPFREMLDLNNENQILVKESQNDPEKQYIVGKCYIEGSNGFPQNTQLGIQFLMNSFKSGSIESLKYYCRLLIKGKIVKKNHEKVKKLINTLLKDQEFVRSFLYGKLFENEENYKEAKKYFERSIELGNSEAMYEYGKLIYSGKIQQFGKEEAINYFMKSIEKGFPKAMLKYGLILIDEEKLDEGIKYIKMATDKNYPKALYYYSKELGKQAELEKNDSEKYHLLKNESTKYLEKSAKYGYMKGMHDYANHLLDDHQQSSKDLPIYLKKCSDKGDFDSMFHYGLFLLQQRKDRNIETEGSKFIRIAANNGHSDSMQKYGEMLLYGNGVPADAEESSKYYQMAIDKGNTTAMVQYSLTFKDDMQKAYNYMKMATDQGNGFLMEFYANALSNLLGTTISKEDAVRYYNMYKGEGDPEALDNMVKLLNSRGIPITKEQMIEINRKISNNEAFINLNDTFNLLTEILGSVSMDSNLVQTGQSNELLNLNGILEMMNNFPAFNLNQSKSGSELYKELADAGSLESMNKYALLKSECEDIESKKEAIKYFKKAADGGYTPAIINYASFLLVGEPTQENKEEAARYFKIAADKGGTIAMIIYSDMLEKGEGVRVNLKEAEKYLKMAADNGNSKAMLSYSIKLFKGQAIKENKEEAIKYCKMAVDQGEKDSKKIYNYMIKEYERISNEEKVKSIKIKVDEGDSSAMYEFANILFKGKIVPKDKSEAVKYFKMAADKGNALAMFKYANLVDNGEGISEDKEEALKYYKLGADNGNLESMNAYAEKLNKGENVEMNKEEAAKYFKIAADKGYEKAMSNYAFMLQKGEGVEMNIEEAVKYFKMAADKGDLSGLISYSVMLFDGQIIAENKKEAIEYIKIAANQGDFQAKKIYEHMLKEYIQISYEKEAQQCKKDADEGDVYSMFRYAEMLDDGKGVPENKEESAKYFKMAADRGNIAAIYNYALRMYGGIGIPVNKEEAAKYFKLGADNEDSPSMNNYAYMLLTGDGIPANKEEAFKYYKMSADSGDADGMLAVASMLFDGKKSPENKEAVKYCKMAADTGNERAIKLYNELLKQFKDEEDAKLFKKQADEGDALSMYQYAYMLDNGEGVPKNKEEAAKYYKMAADKGNSKAMNNYASMLHEGEGIPMNKEEAAKYFKLGAEHGNIISMKNYALILINGDGIPVNKVESAKYLKMAADNGEVSAMIKYADFLEKGEFPSNNQQEEVFKYFKMAAEKGNSLGMLKCASSYMKGIGVQVNNEEAVRYFKMAADNEGDIDICYKYASMKYRGDICEKDLDEALKYFKIAASKGHFESMILMFKLSQEMDNDNAD